MEAHELWIEFSKVAAAHLLAVASPGPDFAIVLRQSLSHGRAIGIWTSIGVGLAILLHVSYSLLGIGLVIGSSEAWFSVLKYAGAAYLTWLGVRGLKARPRLVTEFESRILEPAPSPTAALATGFFTNALNPKASLFFIALFATVISTGTPKVVQLGYGLWMAAGTVAWFSLVSMVFTGEAVRVWFLRRGHWVDRALGAVFIGFAVSLLVAEML